MLPHLSFPSHLYSADRFSDYLFVQEDFKNEEVINFMNNINEDLIIYLTATVRPLVSYLNLNIYLSSYMPFILLQRFYHDAI